MAEVRGGAKLAEALDEIARNLGGGKVATLSVGFLEGAVYSDGTSVPMVAAINEYGAPSRGQPPRPFFRNMIAEKSPEWPSALVGILKAQNYDVDKSLRIMGGGIKGQLQKSINDFSSPALAPSTVEQKGFDKPLIDTSHMINSVDYTVK